MTYLNEDYRVSKWNLQRDNTYFNWNTEEAMLDEEVKEFYEALKNDNIVDMIDAYCDIKFVLCGSIFKINYNSLDITDYPISRYDDVLDSMEDIIRLAFKLQNKALGYNQLDEAFDFVCTANATKGTTKVNGKITKPVDFVGPEAQIKQWVDELQVYDPVQVRRVEL